MTTINWDAYDNLSRGDKDERIRDLQKRGYGFCNGDDDENRLPGFNKYVSKDEMVRGLRRLVCGDAYQIELAKALDYHILCAYRPR